jgi:large subunit ribosomal protein L22
MEVSATSKYLRISPSKIRDLSREIQGLPVTDALKAMTFNKRKGAGLILKTLKSAIANAENNAELSADDLFVKVAAVEKGPVLRRYRFRARGMVSGIQKRTSHIRIVLGDGVDENGETAGAGKEQ